MDNFFDDNELVNIFNDVRLSNIDNKKSYAFIYSELEYFFSSNLNNQKVINDLIQKILSQKSVVIEHTNKVIKLINKLENSLLDMPENSLDFRNGSINFFLINIKKIHNLSKESKKNFHELNILIENLAPNIKDKNGKNLDLIPLDNFIESTLKKIDLLNNNIIFNQNEISTKTEELDNALQKKLGKKNVNLEEYYKEKFEDDTKLIIKNFENKTKNLTDDFENIIKNLKIDQNKINNSSQLMINDVNNGLNELTNLNEKIQKLELNLSKKVGIQSEQIKSELSEKKIEIANHIEKIFTDLNEKTNQINQSHSDFIAIVEKAAIYDLTKNYQTKAGEEKDEYQKFRNYTGGAIGAAIFFTGLILSIPMIEHWGNTSPVDTNYYIVLVRLTISLMFFVLALYFSKQAAKHYECYQENHRTFLQLAALEPFMARMTPDEQKEIRKGLIPSYFSQGTEGKFAAKGDEVDMTILNTIRDMVIDLTSTKKDTNNSENTRS